MASNPKVYSDRSNAAKAAKRLGGIRVRVPTGWIVEMPTGAIPDVVPPPAAEAPAPAPAAPTVEKRADGFYAVGANFEPAAGQPLALGRRVLRGHERRHVLPDQVIERTREWCIQFNFGEWFDKAEIANFIRREFNYGGTTPEQYAERFIRRGVENRDFETRLKQWRWIVH